MWPQLRDMLISEFHTEGYMISALFPTGTADFTDPREHSSNYFQHLMLYEYVFTRLWTRYTLSMLFNVEHKRGVQCAIKVKSLNDEHYSSSMDTAMGVCWKHNAQT